MVSQAAEASLLRLELSLDRLTARQRRYFRWLARTLLVGFGATMAGFAVTFALLALWFGWIP